MDSNLDSSSASGIPASQSLRDILSQVRGGSLNREQAFDELKGILLSSQNAAAIVGDTPSVTMTDLGFTYSFFKLILNNSKGENDDI